MWYVTPPFRFFIRNFIYLYNACAHMSYLSWLLIIVAFLLQSSPSVDGFLTEIRRLCYELRNLHLCYYNVISVIESRRGKTCSTRGRSNKCIQYFSTSLKRIHLGRPVLYYLHNVTKIKSHIQCNLF